MYRKVIIAISLCFLLGGCLGDNRDSHVTIDRYNGETQTIKKHVKKVAKGVTYIDGILIVNKQIELPKTFNPGENQTAKSALQTLLKDANQKGHHLSMASGFRSYALQEQLFNDYVERDGKVKAMTYSAPPGHSEHQSGLAFDIVSENTDTNFTEAFGKTEAGAWIERHASDYGFIIRYPKGKSDITGYQYEPWHLRYVGQSIAQKLKREKTTLEEYVGLYSNISKDE
ncbi:M15 family metallopeptidase [Staphylococcus felis]|uniref:M15 family metallopeptidase n=1 Tax=Staphylococcus felis TaxID=46127 RepID=UPI0021CE5167|nr:M15 family metallopeptidase [Staphylococcus felis]UXR86861.1 M15 family metallopeptidase [Staphylococcus felis]